MERKESMEERARIFESLTEVFRQVFDDENLTISETTTAKDVAEWDSLHHITLIVAIEAEFGIKFKSSEYEEMANVGALVDLIAKKQR